MISYEEYYPYGASAYRAAASGVDLSLKRYRFTGKERDEETGLDYFGVRYYASWLGRWTSGDPGGFVDGLNLYRYVRNNPINGIDREGYSTESINKEKPKTSETDPPKKNVINATNALGNAADEVLITASPIQKWDASTAAWGLLRLIGGVAQAVAGMAGIASSNPAGVVLGVVAISKGFDDINTGWRQLWTGVEQESFVETATEEAYLEMGFNEEEAEATGNTMDILLSSVSPAGVLSNAGKAPKLVTAGSSAVVATDKTAKLAQTARVGQAGSVAAQAADEVGDAYMYNKDDAGNNNPPTPTPKHSYKAPASRHKLRSAKGKTATKEVNTGYDTKAFSMGDDVSAINSGKYTLTDEGYYKLDSGRIYKRHGSDKPGTGQLIPVSGPGIYPMSRGEFNAWKVVNEFGSNTNLVKERISQQLGKTFDSDDLEKAWSIYFRIYK